jgi:hypothetical protein
MRTSTSSGIARSALSMNAEITSPTVIVTTVTPTTASSSTSANVAPVLLRRSDRGGNRNG